MAVGQIELEREVTPRAELPRPFVIGYVALAAVVVLFCFVTAGGARYEDETQYLEIARSLIQGDGYRLHGQLTAYRPPVWPLVLTPVVALPDGMQLVNLVPPLCLAVAGWLAARTGFRLAGPWGLTAGLAVLLYPIDVYTARTLYPQSLALLIVVALVALVVELEVASWRQLSPVKSVLIGLLACALVLTAPTMLLTGGLLLAWILFRLQAGRLRYLLLAGVAGAVPIAAWAGRNLAVLGAAVPLSSTSGLNLLLGNSPNATASSGVRADISSYVDEAARLGLNEVEQNRFFGAAAWDWIGSHPADALSLYLSKVANYFSAYNEPATAGRGGMLAGLVAWSSFGLLVALVVVRFLPPVARVVRPRAIEVFLLVVFVANAPFMAVFFTRTRFRQPVDALLIIEASVTIAVLAMSLVRRRSGRVEGSREPATVGRRSSPE